MLIEFVDPFRNTTVEEFFKYEEDSNSNAYYYLNNFNSLPISGVTLFELTGEQIGVPHCFVFGKNKCETQEP